MCGIFAAYGTENHLLPRRDALCHRGPDDTDCQAVGKTYLDFWRLAINGTEDACQPIVFQGLYLVANAEIYNSKELGGRDGESDCNVILPTIINHGLTLACEMFNGDFAFVYTDGEHIWAARDAVGVRPLFYTRPEGGGIAFASEMKGLLQFQTKIEIFPPGYIYDSKLDAFVCWAPNYWDCPRLDDDVAYVKEQIRDLLFKAVERRVFTSERPVGFFLSGGLDSSIVAALGQKALGSAHRIKTFSIGLEGSPDLKAAREMAEFLDSDHTEVLFTIQEGLAAIKDVVRHTETFDTTTIRASIPMFLLSKYIKDNTDVRVVLSGEGSDELFGGYLYFHSAPNVDEFQRETMRLVRDVHMFDVLRADRTTAAHGLELRVPFFDRDVIDYVMDGFSPELRMPYEGYEKWLLRETFQDLLPASIAWRQKNGMSDAVGYAWADALRKWGESNYKKIFRDIFGRKNDHVVPYMWMPKWSPGVKDPSARVLTHFVDGPPNIPVAPPVQDDFQNEIDWFIKVGDICFMVLTLVSAYIVLSGSGR